MPKISILTHLYYEDSFSIFREYFLFLKKLNTIFFFTLNSNKNNKINISRLRVDFPTSYFIETPNIGKDIGGKMAMIDLSRRLNFETDYYIFLHDKRSPHTNLGETWRTKLFRIIEPNNFDAIIKTFEVEKNVGIICAKEFIANEYDLRTSNFNCSNDTILKELIKKYSLNLKAFDFVGGTMFWIRAEIIHNFFDKHSSLEIRSTLEKGNVLDHEHGTNTHAWERMLSWIAIDQGYTIKGI